MLQHISTKEVITLNNQIQKKSYKNVFSFFVTYIISYLNTILPKI